MVNPSSIPYRSRLRPNAKVPDPNRRLAVFLDRDGVVNQSRVEGGVPRPPRNVGELVIPPEISPALERLAPVFLLVVVSNQPDLARGETTEESVDEINATLIQKLPLDAIYYCPHDDSDRCSCRKPRAGLILGAAAEWGVDMTRSFLIGDRWIDIAAADAAGVKGILLERDYSLLKGADPIFPAFTGKTLPECVNYLLESGPIETNAKGREAPFRGTNL